MSGNIIDKILEVQGGIDIRLEGYDKSFTISDHVFRINNGEKMALFFIDEFKVENRVPVCGYHILKPNADGQIITPDDVLFSYITNNKMFEWRGRDEKNNGK